MTSYRVFCQPSVDSKREEFRKYLEKGGVLDALTRALVNLFDEQEKPTDALEYMKQQLCGTSPSAESSELEATKQQLAEANQKIEELQQEVASLQSKLSQHEGSKDSTSGST